MACSASWPVELRAQAQPFIAGVVRDRVSAAPLPGVTVTVGHTVFTPTGYVLIVDGQAITDATGAYAITQLDSITPDGRYVVVAGGGDFVRVIYPERICEIRCRYFSSTPTVLVPSSNIDFLTRPAGRLVGNVSRADTGAAVASTVVLERTDSATINDGVSTDASGRYEVDALPEGSYWVRTNAPFMSGLLHQIHPAIDLDRTRPYEFAIDEGLATPVAIASNSTARADFQFSVGACLQGHRMSSLNGAPLDVIASIRRLQPPGYSHYSHGAGSTGTTGAGGDYVIDELIPGTVLVKFERGAAYQPNFFPDASTEASAQPILLNAGPCSQGIDANMVPRQVVRGMVRDAVSGVGVPGVEVTFGYYFSGFWPGLVHLHQAVTDAAGEYILQGIEAEPSRLIWTRDVGAYFRQAYFMHPPLTPVAQWTRFDLVQDQSMTGMDFALQRGAFVSGTVTGRIESNYDTTVQVLNDAGETVASARPPGIQGEYATNPFPPGSYRLSVKPGIGSHRYAYPGVSCRGTGPGTGIPLCAVPGAQLISFSALGEHQNYHFDVDAIDTFFRGGFE